MANELTPRIVILHGWENRRPPGHWEHLLANQLRERGYEVDYPQLPDPDTPDLGVWLKELSALIDGPGEPVTLVAHSLATSLWLTRLARGGGTGRVTRLALAAIPAPDGLKSTVVADFVEHPPAIAPLPGVELRIFDGEADPYSPGGLHAHYEVDPAIPVEVVPGGGHLIPDSGFGEWPRILTWVLGPQSDNGVEAETRMPS